MISQKEMLGIIRTEAIEGCSEVHIFGHGIVKVPHEAIIGAGGTENALTAAATVTAKRSRRASRRPNSVRASDGSV